jgi:uncharacterized repeat protein (TIGR03803 family)
MTWRMKGAVVLLMATALGEASVSAADAQFDISDRGTSSPTLAGWTSVTGSADNADTITGSDGTHTLTLTTSGDGQDRDRGTGGFIAEGNFWRDFWFVSNSTTGGPSATATISGLTPDAFYQVEIWGFDAASTGNRAAVWTDGITGNTTTLAFNGSTTPAPASLGDSVATLSAKANGTGVITLTGAAASSGSAGLPNVFINGIRVTLNTSMGTPLTTIEAETGSLGSDFTVNDLDNATDITISTTTSAYNPGSAARVATYAVQFPAPDTYQLYARVRVGPGNFSDDSFFYGNGFGAKSPVTDANWVAVVTGLNTTGFTDSSDVVSIGGGTAGIGVWKWIKFSTLFTVGSGGLTQTFQLGGREDGFHIDKFVFGPYSTSLTVAELDNGIISPPPDFVTFAGPDGVAVHRFGVPSRGATPDGANPASGLVMIGGNLQGATLNGGLQGDGAAFQVSLDGNTFETLESFSSGSDLAHPHGGVSVSGNGFFGVSQAGGTFGTGTVFERKADGTVSILRSFAAVAGHTASNVGGASPTGPLAISGNLLYGTTPAGGPYGNGTVFSVSTSGTGFTVLRDFSALDTGFSTNADGAQPRGGVVPAGGKLYGTTSAGGMGGTGVVFMMDASGSNYTVLHDFEPLDAQAAANTDGAIPSGGLVMSNGVLYGTTLAGGVGGRGTVFAINSDGSGFLTLYHFSPTDPLTGTNDDGASPAAGLILSGNVLYGTTSAGGGGAAGTVFALDPSVPDFRCFHSFGPVAADGTNACGAYPVAPLLRVGHTLFGTAFAGGPGSSGTVFRIPIPLTAQVSAAANPDGTIDATFVGRGAPASNYAIQATNDLHAWETVITQTADHSGFTHYPESGLTTPRRFYRIIEVP